MLKLSAYLCGPMDDCTSEEEHAWRDNLKLALPNVHWRDPTERCYDGHSNKTTLIVENDKADIEVADIVVAYPWKTSSGTPMEIMFSYDRGIPVYTVMPPSGKISPWIEYHSTRVFDSFDELIDFIAHTEHYKLIYNTELYK